MVYITKLLPNNKNIFLENVTNIRDKITIVQYRISDNIKMDDTLLCRLRRLVKTVSA